MWYIRLEKLDDGTLDVEETQYVEKTEVMEQVLQVKKETEAPSS